MNDPTLLEPATRPRIKVFRFLIATGVLVAGMVLMGVLITSRPQPHQEPPAELTARVEIVTVQPSTQTLVVEATGTVVPARQVLLGAEVAGRLVWMSPELVPGGRFKARQALLRIDARDYQLAVEQSEAQVMRSRTELELERGRKRIAEKEWQMLGEQKPADGSLALRDPQVKTAESAVKAAEATERRSRLAVEKTALVAPFNAMVLVEQVDLGQLVAPGTPLATLVGTDEYWVQVSIPLEHLPHIDVPGVSGARQGSPASVVQRIGDQAVQRTGRVVRMAGDVDPIGRLARVLIEIDDPLGLEATSGLPLLLNSFVEIRIEGDAAADVFEIPRTALRDDRRVWIKDHDKLRFRDVEVIWRLRNSVLVRGLSPGDAAITSPVPAPVEGMKVLEVAAAAAAQARGGKAIAPDAAPPAAEARP